MAPHVLNTFSGRTLDLDEPQADQISIRDIAAGLSKICRFGAQASTFFSVAQHAIIVHDLAVASGRKDLALPALHHDSHEAYLGDLPTPVKRKLGLGERGSSYKNLADSIDIAIGRCFGYGWLSDRDDIAAVKRADRQALIAEAGVLLHDAGASVRSALTAEGLQVSDLEPLPDLGPALDPATAEREFLAVHSRALGSAVRSS